MLKHTFIFVLLLIYNCLCSLLQKLQFLAISRTQKFTTSFCSCSNSKAELTVASESRATSSCFLQPWYARGTIFPLFWSDGWTALSELLYLAAQALYSLVLNRLNMQGSGLHSSKINKPNSKLSMAFPPSLSLSLDPSLPTKQNIAFCILIFMDMWMGFFRMSKNSVLIYANSERIVTY